MNAAMMNNNIRILAGNSNPELVSKICEQLSLPLGEALVTTDHVLVETWTLLRHRISRQAAERFWTALRAGAAAVEPVGVADLEVAWQLGLSWRDQEFSIVDRTSFAVMHRLGIDRAASLDNRYAIFRYGPSAAAPSP